MCSVAVRKVEAAAKGVAIDQRQWLRLRLGLGLQHDLRPENARLGARVSRYSATDTDDVDPRILARTHTHSYRQREGVGGCAGIPGHPRVARRLAPLLFKDL